MGGGEKWEATGGKRAENEGGERGCGGRGEYKGRDLERGKREGTSQVQDGHVELTSKKKSFSLLAVLYCLWTRHLLSSGRGARYHSNSMT